MRTRSLGVLALVPALVMAACGDSAEPPEPAPLATTAAPAAEEPEATAPPATSPPATSAATTTTTATSTPATTTAPPTNGPIGYRVTGVAADDVLNVRAGPSASEAIVGTLAPDAIGVVVIDGARDTWHDPWWEVMLDDGTTGWAHSGYLEVDPAWSAPFDTLACAAEMGAGPQTSPERALDDVFVDGFEFLSAPDCDRLVVRLATRAGVAAEPWQWPSRAADHVPAGVAVSTAANHVLVGLPLDVRYGAAGAEFGDVLLLVGDREYGESAMSATAHLIYGSERVAHARFLADPARIVVDIRPASDPSGVDLSPVAKGGVVLTEPALWDGTLPGTRQPLTVTGLGHAYESTLFISLERIDGGPVGASWSGGYDCADDPGSGYCTMSSADFFVGSFAFTIDGLEPGDYVLSMAGECMADEVGEAACEAAVLRHPFTVHGQAGTAADTLAPFFAAAGQLDREIAAAAAEFNAGYDPETGEVSLAAQDSIRSLDVDLGVPPGLSPELERAVLAVYADLASRVAALDGAIRYIPEGSTVNPMPEDILPCLANGSRSKARFAADLAEARRLAALEPSPTAGPASVAAGVLAVRIDAIGLWNRGCDSCGGATYDETLPVDWAGRTVGDGVSFQATFDGARWAIMIHAC